MSASRQRRRTILAAAAALVVGVLFGVLIGRATAPGVDDAIAASRSRGRDISAALRSLPIEYEQSQAGTGGENQSRIEDAVRRVADMAKTALDKAKWLGPGDRAEVTAAIDAVLQAARQQVSQSEFERVVNDAASKVEDVFGSVSTAGA
jgi:hypothetical protein